MNYRPDDWKNPYTYDRCHDECNVCDVEDVCQEAFEAGADAMLEALKESDIRISSEWVEEEFNCATGNYDAFTISFATMECMKETQKLNGTWVFIPEVSNART